MYQIYIHACIDGYSRKVLYIHCSSNKNSHTVLNVFRRCVQEFGFPFKVRSDKGLETKKVAKFVLKNRGVDSNAYITGRSVHNVRVERLWGEVNKITWRYKNLLHHLQSNGILNLDNYRHIQAVAYIFKPRIQRSLEEFKNTWNFHQLRTVKGDIKTPELLYIQTFLLDTRV